MSFFIVVNAKQVPLIQALYSVALIAYIQLIKSKTDICNREFTELCLFLNFVMNKTYRPSPWVQDVIFLSFWVFKF